MSVLAAAGFYGYTLTNVLFLTGVWRYSVLQAGLGSLPARSSPQPSQARPAGWCSGSVPVQCSSRAG